MPRVNKLTPVDKGETPVAAAADPEEPIELVAPSILPLLEAFDTFAAALEGHASSRENEHFHSATEFLNLALMNHVKSDLSALGSLAKAQPWHPPAPAVEVQEAA